MKTLQYWGTGNFQEHPYTGRIVTWTEKEKQTVDDAIATKLLAANAGFVLDNDESGEVVTSQINSVTGGIDFSDKNIRPEMHQLSRSVLTIGGDHPYSQWWGSNGSDGMAAMYLDLAIRPYIAICADESIDQTSGYGATLGKPGMMTVDQAKALQSSGCEFISHGARHTHYWELFNTGIRVFYTGAETSPTVNISTTQLTTSTATTGATNFAFSTYPTIASLQTAINALSGWNCILATELTGSEPSAALMPLNAARSVADLGGADATDSNQRFGISGGILIRYTGAAYRNVSVAVNNGSNFFSIYADGARLIAQSTNAALSTIVSAINALNVPGLTALTMDNGYSAQTVAGSSVLNPGQKIRETYCYGDELGTSLQRINLTRCVNGPGLLVGAGVGFSYTIRRAVLAVKERAESMYGLRISAFAQPGGRMFPWHIDAVADEHMAWRGNRSFTEQNSGLSPHAMPINNPSKFSGHFTSIVATSPSSPYSEADVKAIIDALGDNDGWHVNWLNHLVTPTPGDPSPYTGLNQQSAGTYTSSADQDEGPFYRELVYAAAARDAGKIDILPPTQAEKNRTGRRGPSNLVFNPRFRNGRSNNLVGITTSAQGAGGIACPGWSVSTSSSDWTSVTVDDGEVTLVTNGALGSNRTPFGCNLFLERGKTYSIGATFDLGGLATTAAISLMLQPLQNGLGLSHDSAAQTGMSGPAIYGGSRDAVSFTFTVPPARGPEPAFVRGIAGPFSFTAGDAITVSIDNLGASSPIVLTGLTTAKAVAGAINTALASDAIYGSKAQYHSVATAVNNRLIIQAPEMSAFASNDGSLMQLVNSTGTPLATLFGAGVSSVRATSSANSATDTTIVGYRLAFPMPTTAATSTIKLSAPFCREVRY